MRFSFFRPLTPPVKFCTSMAASMQERGSKRGLAAYKRRASGEKSALRAAAKTSSGWSPVPDCQGSDGCSALDVSVKTLRLS